jgi:hypothetical protein
MSIEKIREINPSRVNKSNTNSDFGYLNILLNNNTDEMVVAEYNETQKEPILTNMNDFQLGVIRLKIPTAAIPLLIFEDGAYIINFSLGANSTNPLVATTVTYDVPSNNILTYPANRYIFYYSQFLTSINNTMRTLWTQAIADPAYIALIPALNQNVGDAPYFRFSTGDTTLIELVTPAVFTVNPSTAFLSRAQPAGINILMSKKLFYFFSGFSSQLSTVGFAGNPLLSYKLQIDPSSDNSANINTAGFEPDGITTCNINVQDYPSAFLWQTLTRLIITTTIPLEKEIVITRNNQGRTERLEVLTDFEIPQTQKGLREYIYFYPQGELRYSNFKSTGWLDRFDLKVYFQTKDLSIYPVLIPPTFEVSLKIEFKRRVALELLQYSQQNPGLQYF